MKRAACRRPRKRQPSTLTVNHGALFYWLMSTILLFSTGGRRPWPFSTGRHPPSGSFQLADVDGTFFGQNYTFHDLLYGKTCSHKNLEKIVLSRASTAILTVDVDQTAFFFLVDVDRQPFSTGRRRPSCSFLHGQRLRLVDAVDVHLQPFSSRPIITKLHILCPNKFLIEKVRRRLR